MLLNVRNIGIIHKASISLDGITVIAGANNTGKSTIGKVLYSIINGLFSIESKIQDERNRLVEFSVYAAFNDKRKTHYVPQSTLDTILEHATQDSDVNALAEFLLEVFGKKEDKIVCYNAANRIKKILGITDEDICRRVIENKLYSEFMDQLTSVGYKKGSIELCTEFGRVMVSIGENRVIKVTKSTDINADAVYIDDPYAVDRLVKNRPVIYTSGYPSHQDDLMEKLTIEHISDVQGAFIEAMVSNDINRILNSICNGKISRTENMGYAFQANDLDEVLSLSNMSAGMKAFIIIKTLLFNGCLKNGSTIILDEPEVHLHPEWQLKFAELIVLLRKEYDLYILINTHSPYFLRALQVYSRKHKLNDVCKFYLSMVNDSEICMDDVTNNTEAVYELLAKPFQTLEDEEYAGDC